VELARRELIHRVRNFTLRQVILREQVQLSVQPGGHRLDLAGPAEDGPGQVIRRDRAAVGDSSRFSGSARGDGLLSSVSLMACLPFYAANDPMEIEHTHWCEIRENFTFKKALQMC
jgi:hypothetical protein